MRHGEEVVSDAPTALGKTYTAATEPWLDHSDVTDDSPVVHFSETREARDDAAESSRNVNSVTEATLKRRKERCPVARGDHDPAEDDDDEDPGSSLRWTALLPRHGSMRCVMDAASRSRLHTPSSPNGTTRAPRRRAVRATLSVRPRASGTAYLARTKPVRRPPTSSTRRNLRETRLQTESGVVPGERRCTHRRASSRRGDLVRASRRARR
ncbi:Putative helicase fused to HTH domain [Haloferax volcanii]|nr:Putative helicase fused to HTH domain [Haloferax lucentense]